MLAVNPLGRVCMDRLRRNSFADYSRAHSITPRYPPAITLPPPFRYTAGENSLANLNVYTCHISPPSNKPQANQPTNKVHLIEV